MPTMTADDRQVRKVLIVTSLVAVLGLLSGILIVTVMVSCNFNILEWIE